MIEKVNTIKVNYMVCLNQADGGDGDNGMKIGNPFVWQRFIMAYIFYSLIFEIVCWSSFAISGRYLSLG